MTSTETSLRADRGWPPAWAGAAILSLLAFCVLVAVPAISTRTPFYTKGEPREALVVQAIARGDGLILPMRNGDEIPSKPPLFHWLGALASVAAGSVSETSIRLPGLVASLITVAATAAAAWVWWGPTTGMIAAVVLATSFQWTASSTTARVDIVLAAAVSLALLLFARAIGKGRVIPVSVFALLAVATLTKGPIGLVLPVAVALVTLGLRGELGLLGRREAKLLSVAAAIAGCWYLLAATLDGDAFVAKQILKENVFRVLDPDSVEAGHVRPFWYYVPLLAAGFAPWSLFLPGLATFVFTRRRRGEVSDPHLVFAASWGAVAVTIFSLAGSKRSVYLLPAYPAFALLVARAWTLLFEEGTVPRGAALALRAGAGLCAVLFALAAGVLIAAALGLPLASLLAAVIGKTDMHNVPALLAATVEHRWTVLPCGLVAAATAWSIWRAAGRGDWYRVVGATATAILAFSATVSTTLLPALAERRSSRAFVARLAAVVPEGAPLSFYRAFDYGAVFYRGSPIPLRSSLSHVPEIDGAWLLTWPSHLPALAEEVGKLDTGGEAAGAYEVEEALASEDVDPSDLSSLVLVRIVRRIGDERSDGKRDPRPRRDPVPARGR